MFRDRRGSITVYTALFLTAGISAGTLAVDVGRMTVLRSEMQNSADAAAMAGAVQLDGRDNARARALDVATNAAQGWSAIPSGAGDLDVASVAYYSVLEPSPVVATGDADAVFLEVELVPKQVNILFQPLLNALIDSASSTTSTLTAVATARIDPFICHAPPLMMCDLSEIDASLDLTQPENAGRQVRLKEAQNSGGPMEPGNFGLLALPDGSVGANAIEGALATVAPEDCYTLDVTTATGSKTQKVRDGMNARFDVNSGWPYPAPNVINYPRDNTLIADSSAFAGDGVWGISGYWQDKHGVAPPPALADGSRYMAYLYELGLEFARDGRRTVYPPGDSLPEGFTLVTPDAADIPVALDPANSDNPIFDGVATGEIAENGPARRLVQVPLLQCIAEGVSGHASYPTDGKYVEFFITETVDAPPEAAIYAEVVRSLTPVNNPDFHANVRLVR
jgi:Flp pilus assembly protein TadG